MDPRKQALAQLLAEVKLSEKKVQKAKAKLPPLEARIKQALVAGKRELAKRYALEFEEQKLAVRRCEQQLALAKRQYEEGQRKALEQPSAKQLRSMQHMAKAMEGLADSLGVLDADQDMLRRLEEDAAHAEARLDIALEDATAKNPELALPADPGPEEAAPPLSTAEDILKEFE